MFYEDRVSKRTNRDSVLGSGCSKAKRPSRSRWPTLFQFLCEMRVNARITLAYFFFLAVFFAAFFFVAMLMPPC
jgi:hypothetical protein